MPGAWELNSKPFMVIGMLHTGIAYFDMVMAALRLERPGWRVTTTFERDKPWDVGRNLVATLALNSGAEWCFFWDSDVVIPPYTLTRLVGRGLPIIGGLYYRRHPDIFPEVFVYGKGGMLDPVPRATLESEVRRTNEQVLPVQGIGAGCLLVNRRVLESLKDKVPHRKVISKGPPAGELDYYEFFTWGIGSPEMHAKGEGYSEDLVFCVRAQREGWKVFVDTTVSCSHLTEMAIRDGQIDWAPVEVGRG